MRGWSYHLLLYTKYWGGTDSFEAGRLGILFWICWIRDAHEMSNWSCQTGRRIELDKLYLCNVRVKIKKGKLQNGSCLEKNKWMTVLLVVSLPETNTTLKKSLHLLLMEPLHQGVVEFFVLIYNLTNIKSTLILITFCNMSTGRNYNRKLVTGMEWWKGNWKEKSDSQ